MAGVSQKKPNKRNDEKQYEKKDFEPLVVARLSSSVERKRNSVDENLGIG